MTEPKIDRPHSERPKVGIVAGNFAQATRYAHDQGWARRDWVYLTADRARGHQLERVEWVGTYFERRDLRDLEAIVATILTP